LQQTKTNIQETARLRVTVNEMQKRLDAITATQEQPPAPAISTTNNPSDLLSP
jgi:hypothetical protein